MNLNTDALVAWIGRLALNVHNPALLGCLRDCCVARGVTGRDFDAMLDQNMLSELLKSSAGEEAYLSPVTANLIRKLWHVDFFPAVQQSDRRVHSHGGRRVAESPSISVEAAADVVDRILEVATPSGGHEREELLERVERVLPSVLQSEICSRHHKI